MLAGAHIPKPSLGALQIAIIFSTVVVSGLAALVVSFCLKLVQVCSLVCKAPTRPPSLL